MAFIVAIVAGAPGFGGIAAGAATVAKVLFGLFLIPALALLPRGVGIFNAAT